MLRRSALALARYHLRVIGRPTPFGLFAGVAMVRIGDQPMLRVGGPPGLHSRPDSGWLDACSNRYAPIRTCSRAPPLSLDRSLLDDCGVDRWYFVRYADPDPHLRLRLHGKPEDLWATLLPRISAWADRLRAAGLLAGFTLDGYDPETERYGGTDAMAAAERVFHADSAVALALAPRLDAGDEDAVLLLS